MRQQVSFGVSFATSAKYAAATLALLYVAAAAAAPQAGMSKEAQHQALQSCAQQHKISLPLPTKIDRTVRQTLLSCLAGKGVTKSVVFGKNYEKDLSTCLAKEGVNVPQGRLPAMDNATKQVYRSCKEQARVAGNKS